LCLRAAFGSLDFHSGNNLLTHENRMSKNRKAEVEAAQKTLDLKNKNYQLELDTSMGKILLDMLSDVAPGHVANILGLAKIGYYDGLGFHRIIKGFMIQGGCPEGTGTGGPGYTIKAEFNKTKHVPGVLSMARTNDPNSAGSQFFICHGDATFLDNQYTAFGKTADDASLEVVKAIGNVPTGSQDRPQKPVTIKTAKVLETAKA
jgi:peptidyl-prolyl cis-trans isomerase B (cyclophilin B)